MSWVPIGERELRAASRRPATFRTRLISATMAVALGFWVLLGDALRQGSARGGELFLILSGSVFLFTAMAGVFFTADSISSEKRDGTLGLLFLTELRGRHVIIGKLLASSLNAFYGALAVIPVMAVPMLVGGVTLGQFWRVVLVLVNTLFLSLALGLLISTVGRRERQVMAGTFGIVVFLSLGSPCLKFIATKFGWPPVITALGSMGSPALAYFFSLDIVYPANRLVFWSSLGFLHGCAWLALFIAGGWLEYSWREASVAGQQESAHADKLSPVSIAARSSARTAEMDGNPFFWLASRGWARRRFFWFGLGFVILLFGVVSALAPNTYLPIVCLVTVLVLHLFLKYWLAAEACHRLATDRSSGNLALLLSTRLTSKDIISGQYRALKKRFSIPLAAVTLVDIILLIVSGSDPVAGWMRVSLTGFAVWVILCSDLYTLAWVGMWAGLATGKVFRAMLNILIRVWLVPTTVFAALLWLTGTRGVRGAELALAWMGVSVITNLFFYTTAIVELEKEFRSIIGGGQAMLLPQSQDNNPPLVELKLS